MGGSGRSFDQLEVILLVGLVCMFTITGFSMDNAVNPTVVMKCIKREGQALLNFKQSLNDPAKLLSSWGSEEDCCRWKGIGCDNQTGHVIMLDLRPIIIYHSGGGFEYIHLTGELSPSLLELHHLNHLDLSFNNFGGRIPGFFGSLSKLTYLNLSWSGFYGTLPLQIGNISSLRSLDLSENYELNVGNLEWLSYLSSLKLLKMTDVDLSGAVDWLKTIKTHPSLSSLDLSTPTSQLPDINPTSISHINSSNSLLVLRLDGNFFSSSIFSWLFNISSNLVYLSLSSIDLKGSVPDSFEGMISLAHLDLSWNELNGPIPDIFGHMTSLVHLDLSNNQLDSRIPKSFGNLCNLKMLDLSGNNLTKQSLNLLQSLTGCLVDSLEILRLSGTQLRGPFPDATRFSSLKELHLDGNQLAGSFPESIDLLSKLVVLNLGRNQLTGPLPESIGRLSSLRVLDLSSNSLSGVISESHMSNLSKLQQLDVSFNSLVVSFNVSWVLCSQLDIIRLSSCKLGPQFPSWLRTQKNFSELDISNSGISDTIPNWFWINLSSRTRYLNLSFNHISSKVPNLLLKFDTFPAMDLSSNLFYGPIPLYFSKMTVLNLSKNMFSGSITFLCTMTDKAMSYLDLSDNLLSGNIPDCWMQFSYLTILNLESNNLSGTIPRTMGSLWQIESMRLRKNSLSGTLPLSLMNCSFLKLLDLGENRFSGEIPEWVGDRLSALIVLRLRSNQFTGKIPINICHLASLQLLDLSLNNISGTIPHCLYNFTAMANKSSTRATISIGYIYFYSYWTKTESSGEATGYHDHARVVWKGAESEFNKTLGLLTIIDLSSNNLIGNIPDEVTSLLELMALNLSRNYLTGIIPKDIGQLKLVEVLDLSWNRLSAEIPRSLADLSFLAVLDLSNNQLSGKIPSSTQLQGFNSSTYMGNSLLCGPPLLRKCSGDGPVQDTPNSGGDENNPRGGQWSRNMYSYVNVGVGFIFGFWGVCGTLVLNISWRHAYFQFLNDCWDWLCLTLALNTAKLGRIFQS